MATSETAFTFPSRLGIDIPDIAFHSWMNSTRRLFKTIRCPICHHRAMVRRGFILCGVCGRGWHMDDIQDLISELEALHTEPLSQIEPGSLEPLRS